MPYGPAAAKQRRLQQEAEARDVLQLWTKGMRFADIPAELEDKYQKPYSIATVHRRWRLARETIIVPATEEAIKEHRVKLNELWSLAMIKAQQGSPQALQQAIAVLDREAKLLGLDRPVKAELAVEVTVTGSIESELSSLSAELALNDFVAIEAEVVEPG